MQVDLKLPVAQRVIIVDDNPSRRDMLIALLQKQGVSVLAVIEDPKFLGSTVTEHAPDAVIVSTAAPGATLLEEMERLQAAGGCPIVLLSQNIASDKLRSAVDAGVNAVVFVGLNGNNLTSAIDLALADFIQNKTLRSRAVEAERALRERKIIERAKGTLMKQRNVDESVAYNLMRRRAMEQGKRLVEIATMINDAAEMLMDTSQPVA
jgi:response regulator NasT